MKTYKKILAFVLAVVLLATSSVNIPTAAEGYDTGDRFYYDGVKYKTARRATASEVFQDSRNGLLLYSYDSGTTASFRETFSGEFSIETKAQAQLSAYTLHFTSVETQEAFSVHISDTGTEIQASVSVGEDTTGIFYETESDWDNNAHGYTTVMNENEKYTTVIGASTATIIFNPETMELKIKKPSDWEEYKTIWCLTEEVMDGKRFNHVLKPFDNYNVSIEFTAVGAGEKGELLIYNVNGEDYGKADLPYVQSNIKTNLTMHAVAGEAYTLPAASVCGVTDEDAVKEITCTIYNASGKEIVSGKVSDGLTFTPEKAGTYYLYYKLSGNLSAENFVTLTAYNAKKVDCSIEACEKLADKVGLNSSLTIPARSAKSVLFTTDDVYTDVTIQKEENVLEEKKNVTQEFAYTFTEYGTYTITWSVSLFGKTYKEQATVTVDETIPGISGAVYEKTYDMGTQFEVPAATVYVKGEAYEAEAEVLKPSGTVVKEKELLLDEIGDYRVDYTCNAGGENIQFVRAFQVAYQTSQLFAAGEDTTISYDDIAGNADMPGVQIEMSSNTSSATYTKTLDLSDNTKKDTLIELYLIPSAIGSADLTGFYVTLTDKLNPENYVSIRVVGDSLHGCYLRAKAAGQSGYVGLHKNHSWEQAPYPWEDVIKDNMNNDKSGFVTYLDLAYNLTEYDLADKTLVLRYDAKEKAIYSHNLFELQHEENDREDLVVDLDDPTMFKSLWTGFTDDSQVEMSITPMSVSGTATFKVMNVDGMNIRSESIADTTAPKVEVDYLGMDGAPTGKVGLAYPIFDLILEDDLCDAESLQVKTTVTKDGKEIAVKDNAFVPDNEGIYKIHYAVSDGFGNTTKKVVDVTVKKNVPEVTIKLDGAFPERLAYGMKAYAPEFNGGGGSGKLTLRTYYVHDGEETEYTGSFVPMDDGEYTLVCEVSDYLGQIAKESKTYEIVFEPEIIVEDAEIVLPFLLPADKTYEFEAYTATYYEKMGEDAKTAKCTIEVTDAQGTNTVGEDRLYVPKMSGSVKTATVRIIFSAEASGKTISKEITREVPLHSIGTTEKFVADYFVGDNAEFAVYNRYMTILAKNASKDMKAQFIKPVQVRDFSMVLKASANEKGAFRSAYKRLRVTMTDKLDGDIKVQFDIIKKGNELAMSINGEKEAKMPGTLTTESQTNIDLAYNNGTFEVFGTENALLGSVKTTLAGEEFAGFPSGEAYITMEFVDVSGASAIDLISINNQTFLSMVQDNTNPEVFVDGSYSGICAAGTSITIPTAAAYDVLNYVSKPKVTVLAPDGSEVKAEDGTVLKDVPADKAYTFVGEQLGQYSITYSASDEVGKTTTVSSTYSIYDDVLPTVTLKGKFPESVKAGKDVKVKRYKVEDNGDTDKVQVTIYYGGPDGLLKPVEGNKIPTTEKGTYYVYFYLVDENGNCNAQTFSFEAR